MCFALIHGNVLKHATRSRYGNVLEYTAVSYNILQPTTCVYTYICINVNVNVNVNVYVYVYVYVYVCMYAHITYTLKHHHVLHDTRTSR